MTFRVWSGATQRGVARVGRWETDSMCHGIRSSVFIMFLCMRVSCSFWRCFEALESCAFGTSRCKQRLASKQAYVHKKWAAMLQAFFLPFARLVGAVAVVFANATLAWTRPWHTWSAGAVCVLRSAVKHS